MDSLWEMVKFGVFVMFCLFLASIVIETAFILFFGGLMGIGKVVEVLCRKKEPDHHSEALDRYIRACDARDARNAARDDGEDLRTIRNWHHS